MKNLFKFEVGEELVSMENPLYRIMIEVRFMNVDTGEGYYYLSVNRNRNARTVDYAENVESKFTRTN